MSQSSNQRSQRTRRDRQDVIGAIRRLLVDTSDDATVRAVAVVATCEIILYALKITIAFRSDVLEFLLGLAASAAIMRVIIVMLVETRRYIKEDGLIR